MLESVAILPEYWEENKKFDIITLSEDSEEFIKIKNKFHNSGLNDKLIVSIQRIQNEKLYFQYQMKKKSFKDSSKPENEKILFHGIKSCDSITGICKFGFNRSFCAKNLTRNINYISFISYYLSLNFFLNSIWKWYLFFSQFLI